MTIMYYENDRLFVTSWVGDGMPLARLVRSDTVEGAVNTANEIIDRDGGLVRLYEVMPTGELKLILSVTQQKIIQVHG